MSMVAIFTMSCCGRDIVSGRHCGSDIYPPTSATCYYGCEPRMALNGGPERFTLRFKGYASFELLDDKLAKTWKNPDKSKNLWKKYNGETSSELFS